jgi:hypothetical protein
MTRLWRALQTRVRCQRRDCHPWRALLRDQWSNSRPLAAQQLSDQFARPRGPDLAFGN